MELNNYNILWNTQSINSSQSMPCGGGDIGLNVWVEDNDVMFYFDRSGNIDENDQQLKNGRMRLHLQPNPFKDYFEQKLDLEQATIIIKGRSGNHATVLKLWVDMYKHMIIADVESSEEIRLTAEFECWRNEKVEIQRTRNEDGTPAEWDVNRWAMFGYFWYDGKIYSYPDRITFDENAIVFAHANTDDCIFDKEVVQQGLTDYYEELNHPTKQRIFGGKIICDGLTASGTTCGTYANIPYHSYRLSSKEPKKKYQLRITMLTEKGKTFETWKTNLDQLCDEYYDMTEARQATLNWWKDFWDRSYICINPTKDENDQGWRLARNYQLARFQMACNALGEFPTRFNGGLFTFDPLYCDYSGQNPDYRAWGAWTAQNQRLVYWWMLKSGDYDAMLPQFNFYKNNLSNAKARTKASWDIDGCSFGEQIGSGGLPLASHYGWKREPGKNKGVANMHAHYYTTQLEFAYMMHEHFRFSDCDLEPYIDFMKEAVIFFMEYYQMLHKERSGSPYDENNYLVLMPSHALETYVGKNAIDLICALKVNLQCLLDLPAKYVSAVEKEKFKDFLTHIPPIEYRFREGHKTLAPLSEDITHTGNFELPQLYPVFPWGLYGVGMPDLQIAIDTWRYGLDEWHNENWDPQEAKDHAFPARDLWYGWTQQAIWLARMGIKEEALGYLIKKLDDARGNNDFNSSERMRFPTFWGPGFDWTPDLNHAGSGMIALQEMLLQTPGEKIILLPSWPAEWDVEFKLYAPYDTLVEVSLKDKVLHYKVDCRGKDVIVACEGLSEIRAL